LVRVFCREGMEAAGYQAPAPVFALDPPLPRGGGTYLIALATIAFKRVRAMGIRSFRGVITWTELAAR
jgi:hypothetical protein